MTKHVLLEEIRLDKGAHNSPESGMCLLEAVAYFKGASFSDHPECVSPILGSFGRAWNDALDNETRQRLTPFIPKLIGTAGDGKDERRFWLLIDWLIRTYTPTWLRKAAHLKKSGKLGQYADELANHAEILDSAGVESVLPIIEKARKDAAAARAAAWAAAGAAAGDALKPTVEELQESAFALFERLIEASEPALV